MKRTMCLALVLMLATLTASATTIDVPNVTLMGPTLDLNVQITDVVDLYAYQFDIVYDPTVLAALSFTEGSFLSTGGASVFLPPIIDKTAGTITLMTNTLLGAVPGLSGSGTLATIQFRRRTMGVSPITVSNVVVLNSTLADIPVEAQNGSVTVLIPEPTTALLLGSAIGLGLLRRHWKDVFIGVRRTARY